MPQEYGVIFDDILKQLTDIKEVCGDTQNRVIKIEGELKNTTELSKKHEKILFGDAEQMGKGGMIDTVKGIGNSLDNFKAKYALILIGITSAIQIVFAVFVNKFFHRG